MSYCADPEILSGVGGGGSSSDGQKTDLIYILVLNLFLYFSKDSERVQLFQGVRVQMFISIEHI